MPRQLSKAEQEYIKAHHADMTADQLCEDMPGVGSKTVERFIQENVIPNAKADESHEERKEKLEQASGIKVGDLMGRDPSRGIAAMTAAAGELADVRRFKNMQSQEEAVKQKNDRIHVIDPSKGTR